MCEAAWTADDGSPVRVGIEERCLPAMVCDGWVGCAAVRGNAQDGWFVAQSDRVARGEIVSVGNVCTSGARCDAVTLQPPNMQCPAWSVPPIITAAPYRCVDDGGCRRAASEHP